MFPKMMRVTYVVVPGIVLAILQVNTGKHTSAFTSARMSSLKPYVSPDAFLLFQWKNAGESARDM